VYLREKRTSCLAICARREYRVWRFLWGEENITIGDSVEEKRTSCLAICLGKVDVTVGDSVEEKKMLCLAICLARRECYDWRFC
jgi:hypothetical protein